MASIRAILGHGQRGAKNEAAHRRAGGHSPGLPVRLVATAAHGRAAGAGRPDAKERGRSIARAGARMDEQDGNEPARIRTGGLSLHAPPLRTSSQKTVEDLSAKTNRRDAVRVPSQ